MIVGQDDFHDVSSARARGFFRRAVLVAQTYGAHQNALVDGGECVEVARLLKDGEDLRRRLGVLTCRTFESGEDQLLGVARRIVQEERGEQWEVLSDTCRGVVSSLGESRERNQLHGTVG